MIDTRSGSLLREIYDASRARDVFGYFPHLRASNWKPESAKNVRYESTVGEIIKYMDNPSSHMKEFSGTVLGFFLQSIAKVRTKLGHVLTKS